MRNVFILCMVLFPSLTLALEVTPTLEQVEQAKNEGKKMAKAYKEGNNTVLQELTALINRYEFGTGGICGGGTISTKLKNIVLSAYLEEKKGKDLEKETVKDILKNESFEVETGSCYRNPSHVGKDRLVLKQNGKVVEPQKIQQASKTIKAGMYLNTVKAEFALKGIDPHAFATFVLIPAVGEEFQFAVNLDSMP